MDVSHRPCIKLFECFNNNDTPMCFFVFMNMVFKFSIQLLTFEGLDVHVYVDIRNN